MIARQPPPTGIADVLAYPLEPLPCPECTTPRPRLATVAAIRIGRCPRCNDARVVYRSAATPTFPPEVA